MNFEHKKQTNIDLYWLNIVEIRILYIKSLTFGYLEFRNM